MRANTNRTTHLHGGSQAMIDSQTLTASKDGRTSILKANYKVKDIKAVLKGLKV